MSTPTTNTSAPSPKMQPVRVAADLSDAVGVLYDALVALSTFGAEAIASPLLTRIHEVERLQQLAGTHLRTTEDLRVRYNDSLTQLNAARVAHEEDRATNSLLRRRQVEAGKAWVEALRELLREEVRQNRLTRRQAGRIATVAATIVSESTQESTDG